MNYETVVTLCRGEVAAHPVWKQIEASVDTAVPVSSCLSEYTHVLGVEDYEVLDVFYRIRASFETMEETDIVLGAQDRAWPVQLQDMHDAPRFLYLRGNPALLGQDGISVIGTRSPSPSGREMAFLSYLYIPSRNCR